MSTINNRARAVLELVKHAQYAGIPENAAETILDRPQDRLLLRELAANSVVLLKNDNDILPFKKNQRVAVIGPNSRIATYCGGGSASLNAYRAVTPFDGMKALAQGPVDFAQGAYSHQFLPLLGGHLLTPGGEPGFIIRTYNDPVSVQSRVPLEERVLNSSNMFFIDYTHPKLSLVWYAEIEGTFTPETSGTYDFGVCVQGTAELFVDGQKIVSNVDDQRPGSSFLGNGTAEEIGSLDLEAGRHYTITIQWGCSKTSRLRKPGTVDFGKGGLRFGACRRLDPAEAIRDAVELASKVDQVIVFAGLSGEWETEGDDRSTMDLPPHSDNLISAVLDANRNAVVVIQSGTPVRMPWIHKASAVLQAWYGGNEAGHGIADVVYGDVNPCAKLPLSFPRDLRDTPSHLNMRSEGGRILYGEDVYVGYRYHEAAGIEPLFPFGHGLSYTTFALSNLQVATDNNNNSLRVRCELKNTGALAGAEVIQIYIAPAPTPLIRRPVKELKGFSKSTLLPQHRGFVDFDLDLLRATSFWEEKEGLWCSLAGSYRVLVGTSSSGEFIESSFEMEHTVTWLGNQG